MILSSHFEHVFEANAEWLLPTAYSLLAHRTGRRQSLRREMSIVNENDQADRAISTGKLHALPHFHTRPINVVVFHGSDREYSFSGGFPA